MFLQPSDASLNYGSALYCVKENRVKSKVLKNVLIQERSVPIKDKLGNGDVCPASLPGDRHLPDW